MTKYQEQVIWNYSNHIAVGVFRIRYADKQTIKDLVERIRNANEALFGTYTDSSNAVFKKGPTKEAIILLNKAMITSTLCKCKNKSRAVMILNKALASA